MANIKSEWNARGVRVIFSNPKILSAREKIKKPRKDIMSFSYNVKVYFTKETAGPYTQPVLTQDGENIPFILYIKDDSKKKVLDINTTNFSAILNISKIIKKLQKDDFDANTWQHLEDTEREVQMRKTYCTDQVVNEDMYEFSRFVSIATAENGVSHFYEQYSMFIGNGRERDGIPYSDGVHINYLTKTEIEEFRKSVKRFIKDAVKEYNDAGNDAATEEQTSEFAESVKEAAEQRLKLRVIDKKENVTKMVNQANSVTDFSLRIPAVMELNEFKSLIKKIKLEGILRMSLILSFPIMSCIDITNIPILFIMAAIVVMAEIEGYMSLLTLTEAVLLENGLSDGKVRMLEASLSTVKICKTDIVSYDNFGRTMIAYDVTLCGCDKKYTLYVHSKLKLSEEFLMCGKFTFFVVPDGDTYDLILIY